MFSQSFTSPSGLRYSLRYSSCFFTCMHISQPTLAKESKPSALPDSVLLKTPYIFHRNDSFSNLTQSQSVAKSPFRCNGRLVDLEYTARWNSNTHNRMLRKHCPYDAIYFPAHVDRQGETFKRKTNLPYRDSLE